MLSLRQSRRSDHASQAVSEVGSRKSEVRVFMYMYSTCTGMLRIPEVQASNTTSNSKFRTSWSQFSHTVATR